MSAGGTDGFETVTTEGLASVGEGGATESAHAFVYPCVRVFRRPHIIKPSLAFYTLSLPLSHYRRISPIVSPITYIFDVSL